MGGGSPDRDQQLQSLQRSDQSEKRFCRGTLPVESSSEDLL